MRRWKSTPPQRLLDDVGAFEQSLFSSDRIRDLSAALSAGTLPLPSADPPLDPLERQGKDVFVRSCAHCPRWFLASTTEAPIRRFHDIDTTCPSPVGQGLAGALVVCALLCEPVSQRANLRDHASERRKGSPHELRSRSRLVDGLRGRRSAARRRLEQARRAYALRHRQTAPYFHNNSAATLEAVVDHTRSLFQSSAGGGPPSTKPVDKARPGSELVRRAFAPLGSVIS